MDASARIEGDPAQRKYTCLQPALYAAGAVLLLHIVFMLLSGKYPWSANDYNSYVLQCLSWLEGRLDLGQNYPWLELAEYQGKYYVSFPPFPSFLLLPFAAIFGSSTPDGLLALISMLTGCIYAVRIAKHFGLSDRYAMLLAIFLYGGTSVWQITVDAWVWFIAQNLALTLTLMALFYALTSKPGWSMLLLCGAVGCRPFQILWLPLCLYLLCKSRPEKTFPAALGKVVFEKPWKYLPAALLAGSFLLLNYLRFGNPLEFGHNYLPEFTAPGSSQFSTAYIAENFKSLFRLPSWDSDGGRLYFPQYNGMNIFIAFPIFLWHLLLQLRALPGMLRKEKDSPWMLSLLVLACAALHVLALLFHRTMGGFHYGHRYVGDILPGTFVGLTALSAQWYAEDAPDGQGSFSLLWDTVLSALLLAGMLFSFIGVLDLYI